MGRGKGGDGKSGEIPKARRMPSDFVVSTDLVSRAADERGKIPGVTGQERETMLRQVEQSLGRDTPEE